MEEQAVFATDKTLVRALEKSLLRGVESGEVAGMIQCLSVRVRSFKRGETVFWEGERVADVGIVVSGEARSLKFSTAGNAVIIATIHSGGYLGVMLAASRDRISPVTVQAHTDMTAAFVPFERIVGVCDKVCRRHSTVVMNFLDAVAEKALLLHDRNDCLIKSSVRDKVLTFLRRAGKDKDGKAFDVPLDRREMAEYLNVERSALSRELARMRDEGIIEFYKNTFRLIK